ncbi:conserved hypothetical protein [Rhizobium sp. EC-SD404]|nr:conserved hypothetical protein [Rhizobium sp. EC-SD404]
MVAQSDWLPMMMATGVPAALMACSSRNDIRNDLVLDLRDPVLDDQLLLLHALDAQRFAADLNHSLDGNVIIFMFLPQPRRHEAQFTLILIGHALPHSTPEKPRFWQQPQCIFGEARTTHSGVTGSYQWS